MNPLQSSIDAELDADRQALRDLVIETFEIEELSTLDVTAPLKISLCSSTCSACCG